MRTHDDVTNVVIAGLGGQGVLKASDILADAAFLAGLDVKKSEVHGMSQRGGSVSSDVRFGRGSLAPWCRPARPTSSSSWPPTRSRSIARCLRPGGVFIDRRHRSTRPALPHRRSLNVALLGATEPAFGH